MLTRKQEGFARDVAAGKTQTDAYRENYDTQTPKDESVWQQASHVAGNVKVSSRINDLVSQAIETAIPKEKIAEYVNGKLVKVIETTENDGARCQALGLLGKHIGMYRDVIEDVERHMSMNELVSQLAGDDTALKAQLLARFAPDNDAETTH